LGTFPRTSGETQPALEAEESPPALQNNSLSPAFQAEYFAMSRVRWLLPLLLIGLRTGAAQTSPDSPPVPLSLRQAVEIALSPDGNAALRLARESELMVQAQSRQSRAALLPTFTGSIHEQNQLVNVAALGVQVQVAGIPVVLSNDPFSTFDARISAQQVIFDWGAVRSTQASHAAVQSAKEASKSAQEATVSRVAQSYFAALQGEALLETARSNVSLAEALVTLAEDRMSAGQGIAIEVTRARSQLAHEQQQMLAAENGSFRARLRLCRDIGLPLDCRIALADKLSFNKIDSITVEDALQAALQARADLKAQQERTDVARLLDSAAKAESLPSLYGYADYGPLGLTPEQAIETYTVGVGLKIPIFDGGRREARRAEAASVTRQEQVKEKDVRAQIGLEIRESLESLRVAAAQVEVSEQAVALAEEELAQARRRYDAGLTTSLEVVEGQTRLERARNERIAALYAHNLARLELARSMGNVMSVIR